MSSGFRDVRRPEYDDMGDDPGEFEQTLGCTLWGTLGCTYALDCGAIHDFGKHETDFTAWSSTAKLTEILSTSRRAKPFITKIGPQLCRVTAPNRTTRNRWMRRIRRNCVVHHVYHDVETDEELLVGGTIYLRLRRKNDQWLSDILRIFALVIDRVQGQTHILRLTSATGINPIKVARRIAMRPEVEVCTPEILCHLGHPTSVSSMMEFSAENRVAEHRFAAVTPNTPFEVGPPSPSTKSTSSSGADSINSVARFPDSWHLTSNLDTNHDTNVSPAASIRAVEAWQITPGIPEIVVAVMDDGFDLGHETFARPGKIDPRGRDFRAHDDDPSAEELDLHGTSVAALAVGSSSVFPGVAPGCTLLPLRVDQGAVRPSLLLEPIRYASQFADVLNISAQMSPTSSPPDLLERGFVEEIEEIVRYGGRRGKGLVIVVAAGNYGAPTFLPRHLNLQGIRIRENGTNRNLRRQTDVYTGYPNLPGVIVVSSITSQLRKAGYSNWGREITVAAPSNNGHPLHEANVPPWSEHAFPGLPLWTAISAQSSRLSPTSYGEFGGTSGAAPLVAGVAALILSVNPLLEAWEVRRILAATASRQCDPSLDLEEDPNLQGFHGVFYQHQSLFFGAGRVDAVRAVKRAQLLASSEM